MPDFRVYCVPPAHGAAALTLSPEESHHLVTVNRARTGDPVTAFDGAGTEWQTRVSSAHKHHAVLAIESTRQAPPRSGDVTLAQALPKGPVMDVIVRKATELGAARIIPVESARTQVHLDANRYDRKGARWQSAALEAAKQCGNPWLPAIDPPTSFPAVLTATHEADLRLVASLHPGAGSLRSAFAAARERLGRPPRQIVWLIGPEGDFTPDEIRLALEAGFAPITLGPLVLRCDTAAIAALSVVNYELQQG